MTNSGKPVLMKNSGENPTSAENFGLEKTRLNAEKENRAEKGLEVTKAREKVLKEIEELRVAAPRPVWNGGLVDISNLQKAKRARQKEIEKIMEENLEQIYLGLPPEKQISFMAAGEKTAIEISTLLDKGKATLKIIIDLLKKWLSLIPGVNKYFLEQEAKIKADKILENRYFEG